MNKFLKISVTPLVVGVIAAILVFTDGLIAPLFVAGASFTWMAFVNWTVFFGSPLIDRVKAIIGYIIGFLAANAIVLIGTSLDNIISLNLTNIAIGNIIAVFLINFVVMYFDRAKKLFMDSISGIFVGIALTFSGAGVSLQVSDPKLLLLLIVYGILGLLCGLGTNFFVGKINKKIKDK